MRGRLILVLPSILLAAAIGTAIIHAQPTAQSPDPRSGPAIVNPIIEPGYGVGPLKLGDSQERALQLFPRKDEDQQWQDGCGTALDWVDTNNREGRGDLLIRVKKDKVIQIESSTTRFHTAEGITSFDPPEKIRNEYRDMLAFTLMTAPTAAFGDRPLVFWIDKKKGIAFAFVYYPAKQKRYVYKIIVFAPNKTFCPEGESTSSTKWLQIDSYALEPPSGLDWNR